MAAVLGLRASNSPGDVWLFLGLFGAAFALMIWAWASERRGRRRTSLTGILLFAALFRFVLLFAGLPAEDRFGALRDDLAGSEPGYRTFLFYDNDVWRYLWDGHVSATGASPYQRTPNEWRDWVESRPEEGPPLESELWWDVFDNVSFRNYTTVYPPLAQSLFRLTHLLAPGSVFVLKLLLALIDLGCCLAVAGLLQALGRPRRELLFYAWNPLVLKEFAGSGHVDVLMVLLVTVAALALIRRQGARAHLLLGLAIAAKLGAVLLLPLFWRRTRPSTWALAPIAATLVSWRYLGDLDDLARGLGAFAREWVFNSGPWVGVRDLLAAVGVESPDLWAHLLTKGAVVATVVWVLRASEFEPLAWMRGVLLVFGTLIVLNPAVMPWYLPWALPFAVAVGCRSWVLLTGLSLLSYLFYVDQGAASWWLWVEWSIFIAALGWESRRVRVRA